MATPDDPNNTPPAPAIAVDLFCPSCAYNLRGLTGNRCPECGGSIDDLRDPVSRIPWVHRKQLGWWRAYWKTVYFVMFKQKHFVNEMARPVSFRDSQVFRWVTIGFAYLPILLANLMVMVWPIPSSSMDDYTAAVFKMVWIPTSLHVGYILFLAAATGIPSYFFQHRSVPIRQQNRAIALGYYACGPLSLALVPSAFWSIGMQLDFNNNRGDLCALLTFSTAIGLFVVWWLDLIHLARRLLPQHPGRATVIGVVVPALWLALIVVLVPGVLLLVGSLVFVYNTFA